MMTKILNLAKSDLPRERLTKYGPAKLRDYELLAILLGSGIKGKNVISLARGVLKKIKEIGIEKISTDNIESIKGMGYIKAVQVAALIELSKRLLMPLPEVLLPEDVWKLSADFRGSKREHLVAFYLDTQGRLIDRQIISIGTLDRNLAHPREVFEPAVSLRANSIILAHNHPSGVLEYSDADVKITKLMMKAGDILGIELTDHMIVTPSGYISFQSNKPF